MQGNELLHSLHTRWGLVHISTLQYYSYTYIRYRDPRVNGNTDKSGTVWWPATDEHDDNYHNPLQPISPVRARSTRYYRRIVPIGALVSNIDSQNMMVRAIMQDTHAYYTRGLVQRKKKK